MSWLKEVELESELVTLKPLTLEHEQELMLAASDGELWQLWFTSVPKPQDTKAYILKALAQFEAGISLPFVVVDNSSGKVVGCTRFCSAQPEHRRIEIGYTWYAKSSQKTGINTQTKRLLLEYAFEQLHCIAVEFRTHWHNQNSRAAIARLGAKQDGVLRNHQIMADGSYRDTVVFSITNNDWPAVKASLKHKLDAHRK